MSKKPWRNPANPEYQSPALDTSTQDQPRPEGRGQDTVQPAKEGQAPIPPAEKGGGWARFTEEDARNALQKAAMALSHFLNLSCETISRAEPEDLTELFQPSPREKYALSSTPQKRPRAGHSPLLVLIKLTLSAANQVKRIIGVLHPKLVQTKATAALEAVIAKAQTMAQPGAKPATA